MKMDDSTKDNSTSQPRPRPLLESAPEYKLLTDSPKYLPVPYGEVDEEVAGEGYRVLLYNDEVHSMEEVALQLMKALECTLDVAAAIMLRAHNNGKAVVTIAARREADRVASVLREIALLVSVDRL
jgi:ATP-dependent Clp protease adapter protein ClpS